jgi:hypothetical protein
VEERCEAIMAAADAAVASLMQELKMQLIQLPKKVMAANAVALTPFVILASTGTHQAP